MVGIWIYTVKSNHAKIHWIFMAAGLWLYSLFFLLLVIDFSINTRQFNANEQIKTAFATNGTILTIIHWKISINLFIDSQEFITVCLPFLYKQIIIILLYYYLAKFIYKYHASVEAQTKNQSIKKAISTPALFSMILRL